MAKNKKQKSKVKRKRGKKFNYNENFKEKEKKSNPFENFSQNKFIKSDNNRYSQLKADYNNLFNVNKFKDNRLAENSKLNDEQKMKMRFNMQQLFNNKKSKFAFDDDDNEDLQLKHNGKIITNKDEFDKDFEILNDNEEYNQQMNEYLERINADSKLSKKDKLAQIISQSKLLKQQKQQIKQENQDKINYLNDNFNEINSMLLKRKRNFNRFNDDYDQMTSHYNYAPKTHPTDRIKSQEEIEQELNQKMKKQELQKLKEDVDNEEEESEDINNVKLTKKERIEKLLQQRLKNSKINKDNEENNSEEEEEEESDNESEENSESDDLSDLNELEQQEENEESENSSENEENEEEEEENEENEEEEEDNE